MVNSIVCLFCYMCGGRKTFYASDECLCVGVVCAQNYMPRVEQKRSLEKEKNYFGLDGVCVSECWCVWVGSERERAISEEEEDDATWQLCIRH